MAIEGSLRMIPAHGKHRIVIQTLLTGNRVCEGIRSSASFFSFLAHMPLEGETVMIRMKDGQCCQANNYSQL